MRLWGFQGSCDPAGKSGMETKGRVLSSRGTEEKHQKKLKCPLHITDMSRQFSLLGFPVSPAGPSASSCAGNRTDPPAMCVSMSSKLSVSLSHEDLPQIRACDVPTFLISRGFAKCEKYLF